jgi:RNA polymerase nonessential primary-like sigma factor
MMEYTYSSDVRPEASGLEMESTEVSQKPLLSNEQQLALISLIKADDPDTKQRLIAHNLRLVVNIAKRYCDHGVALYDLVREGVQGLIHALKNFELDGGFRFTAYARQCIRQSIECAIMRQNNHTLFVAS